MCGVVQRIIACFVQTGVMVVAPVVVRQYSCVECSSYEGVKMNAIISILKVFACFIVAHSRKHVLPYILY